MAMQIGMGFGKFLARVLFQELGVSVPSSVFHVLFITRSLHANMPLGRLRLPSGSFAIPLGNPTRTSELSAGEWDFQIAARKASGRTGGAPRGGEGGGSRGEAALAVSHSAAREGGAPLPCARHFLWGTFLI